MDTTCVKKRRLDELAEEMERIRTELRAEEVDARWRVTVIPFIFIDRKDEELAFSVVLAGDVSLPENHGMLTASIVEKYPNALITYKRCIYTPFKEKSCSSVYEVMKELQERESELCEFNAKVIGITRQYRYSYLFYLPEDTDISAHMCTTPDDDKMMNVLVDHRGEFVKKWFG